VGFFVGRRFARSLKWSTTTATVGAWAYAYSHAFVYDLVGNRTDADGTDCMFDSANRITNSGYTDDVDSELLSGGTTSYIWDDRGDHKLRL
jgi:hypothetical protein